MCIYQTLSSFLQIPFQCVTPYQYYSAFEVFKFSDSNCSLRTSPLENHSTRQSMISMRRLSNHCRATCRTTSPVTGGLLRLKTENLQPWRSYEPNGRVGLSYMKHRLQCSACFIVHRHRAYQVTWQEFALNLDTADLPNYSRLLNGLSNVTLRY